MRAVAVTVHAIATYLWDVLGAMMAITGTFWDVTSSVSAVTAFVWCVTVAVWAVAVAMWAVAVAMWAYLMKTPFDVFILTRFFIVFKKSLCYVQNSDTLET